MNASYTILNLGCGTKTSPHVVNIDWSIYQRMRNNAVGRLAARLVLHGERKERFESLEGEFVVYDLRRGIPAQTGSVDAVYHSHTLEHIDRDVVPSFFAEVLRVLKPGGIHRVVVPDLELHVRDYLTNLDASGIDHDRAIALIIEQAVRREAYGTSRQAPLRRRLENIVFGDARRRGETHQWMWDRLNLRQALEKSDFVEIEQLDAYTSGIPNWNKIGLDLNPDGRVYKPGSLFMEARKPAATDPGSID